MRFHSLPANIGFFSPVALIATFFGSGLVRPASGTWGSLAAFGVGLVVLAAPAAAWVLAVMSVVAYCLGHWAALRWTQEDDTDADPSAIVIDGCRHVVGDGFRANHLCYTHGCLSSFPAV